MRGSVGFLAAFLHGNEGFGSVDTVGSMSATPGIADVSPIETLHSVLLGSVRIGIGNWRFYFVGVELTVWGELSMVRDQRKFTRKTADFFSEFRGLWGCELSFAEIADGAVTLHFGHDTVTITSTDDGELASVLFIGDELADIWTWVDGNLSLGKGLREPFDGLSQ
jgi:hypothetical protein